MKKIIPVVILLILTMCNVCVAETNYRNKMEEFKLIESTSVEKSLDSHSFYYPDLSVVFDVVEINNYGVERVTLIKEGKKYQLTLDDIFYHDNLDIPLNYYKGKDVSIFVYNDDDYYRGSYSIFALDKQDRFYLLGRFSIEKKDVEEPHFEALTFDVLKDNNEIIISTNKEIGTIRYILKD